MGLYYSVSSSLMLVNTNTVDILLTVGMNYVKPMDSISPVMASSRKILLAPATDEQVLCDPYRCHSRYGNKIETYYATKPCFLFKTTGMLFKK